MGLPGGSVASIGDLIQDVIDALAGRSDVEAIVPRYLKKSIIELTESTSFEELRTTGPQQSLTIGKPNYPVTMFLNNGEDYTMPESFGIYVDYPNNSVVGRVNYKTVKAIETMIAPATLGLPSKFTRYGTEFFFGPNPNQSYTVFLRYQKKHPFPVDDDALEYAPIFMPEDWLDILSYAAAMRIAVVKRWPDQVTELHTLLYGDPEYMSSQGKMGRPGLLSARLLQIERDQKFNTRQITVAVGRYNAR